MKRILKNRILLIGFLTILLVSTEFLQAQEATWVWYPGDYEIWLSNKMQNRRTERGALYLPFWRYYSHYNLVDFTKTYTINKAEEVEVFVEGDYSIRIDGNLVFGNPKKVTFPAGTHKIHMKVFCQDKVPAVFFKGDKVITDNSWKATFENREWHDESGDASDISATEWKTVGYWDFNSPEKLPSEFALATKPENAVSVVKNGKNQFVDFGKETFGFVKIHGLKGSGNLMLYYGESKEEATAIDNCLTLDKIEVNNLKKEDYVLEGSKAFRFVNVHPDVSVTFDSISMLYEYLPLDYRGSFKCSDELINKIWDVSAYTLHLNSREFFIDGIKRDRWLWSGDAYQSYLMNYYLFFDNPSVKRTLLALRGKEPVSSHINTIMDYSFYWFLGIYDYYIYTGDKLFIEQYYDKMVSLMEFCLERRNENGMMEGLPGDWVYVDWAPMSKKGELSIEQLLFSRSLEAMSMCAELVGDKKGAEKYGKFAKELAAKLEPAFWSDEKNAFVHNRVDGVQQDEITRYTNMFAVLFDNVDEQKELAIKEHVLLNDDVQQITTPYMRFYELEALCDLGEQKYVLEEMRDYWGGMLDLGATSFWEKYDPTLADDEHYAMYGHPFGKSLCHAWGASPIYLLGKYYLGVKPLAPGYSQYQIEPALGDLEWMEGSVPMPDGDIEVYCNKKEIKVEATGTGNGILRFKSSSKPSCKGVEIQSKGNGVYEMNIEKGNNYSVKYKSLK